MGFLFAKVNFFLRMVVTELAPLEMKFLHSHGASSVATNYFKNAELPSPFTLYAIAL